ncbi:MAG: hypothetical protein NT074_02360, partial [Methanomicrobiales archaeon]|nr:hypothetical protein [Methanomicrobiales archaeon]
CAELEAQHKRRDFIMLQRGSLKKAKKDGYVEGREDGHEEGREEGLTKGREEGREEGLTKGREEGREEGLKEGRVLIAKQLKAMGFSSNEIVKATGLSETELLQIK